MVWGKWDLTYSGRISRVLMSGADGGLPMMRCACNVEGCWGHMMLVCIMMFVCVGCASKARAHDDVLHMRMMIEC